MNIKEVLNKGLIIEKLANSTINDIKHYLELNNIKSITAKVTTTTTTTTTTKSIIETNFISKLILNQGKLISNDIDLSN